MKAFGITDIGMVRSMNQDFVFTSETPVGILPNLLIVADGMGGHKAGNLASSLAVETMVDTIRNHEEERNIIALLCLGLEEANRVVYTKAAENEEYHGMGTTVVAAVMEEQCAYIVNVGDSRAYLIGQEIDQITRDHSLVEEMVRKGELTKEEARNHPDRNIITRAVGTRRDVKIDCFDVNMEEGERLLLCSDGLTNMLEDSQIQALVRTEDRLEEAGRCLIDTANKNGGRDNISVVLAQLQDCEVETC